MSHPGAPGMKIFEGNFYLCVNTKSLWNPLTSHWQVTENIIPYISFSLTYIFSNISDVFWFTNTFARSSCELFFFLPSLWEWSRWVFCGPLLYTLRNWVGVSPEGPQEEKVDSIFNDLDQEWKTHLSWVSQQNQGKPVTRELEGFHREEEQKRFEKEKKIRKNKGGREESKKNEQRRSGCGR